MPLAPNSLARRAELLLRPAASRADIERLCAAAIQVGLYGLAVPTSRVELARTLLEGSEAKVVALVSFPLGESDSDVKRFETEVAADLGAHEIQYALHTARLLDAEGGALLREMRDLVEASDELPVTVTIEPHRFSADQVRSICEMILDSGIQGVANIFGQGSEGTCDFIKGLRAMLGPKFLIKGALLGVELPALGELLDAGASRIQGGEELLAASQQV